MKPKLRQLTGQRLSNVRKQQKLISIEPILFIYYEESLVLLNLNSKQLRFHGAHPNVGRLQILDRIEFRQSIPANCCSYFL